MCKLPPDSFDKAARGTTRFHPSAPINSSSDLFFLSSVRPLPERSDSRQAVNIAFEMARHTFPSAFSQKKHAIE
jgi:hypothetical protein